MIVDFEMKREAINIDKLWLRYEHVLGLSGSMAIGLSALDVISGASSVEEWSRATRYLDLRGYVIIAI